MKEKRNTISYNQVFHALKTLCSKPSSQSSTPPQELWPTTRDIANHCNVSIYIARYYLMKMVKEGRIYVTPESINNTHRWYIAARARPAKKGIEK